MSEPAKPRNGKDLAAHVTKELQGLDLGKYMSRDEWDREYERKRQKIERDMTRATSAATKSKHQSLLSLHDRKKYFERKKYFKTVDHLIRDWMESIEGVVVGLRYDENNHKFIAQARYIDERRGQRRH
ncbi:MAG: hypothetical protein MZW92_03010 [Comamonadaceae bacterium]|nr:hypothetical protein [Comamonadaceae bacterium]